MFGMEVAPITIFGLFLQANLAVKCVMIGLLTSSVWCWAIIIDKVITHAAMRRSVKHFEQIFWSGSSLEELYRQFKDRNASGMTAIFMAAMKEWKKSFEKGANFPFGLQMRIEKAMNITLSRELEYMEARLDFLATIGSASPFIGLFGTVIGIMTSFQSIAAVKNTNLAIVAPGIAEALLATATGLFVAIPAVIAYNNFLGNVNKMATRFEGFSDEFSGILSRQIDEHISACSAKI